MAKASEPSVASVLSDALISEDVPSASLNPANVVDVIAFVGNRINRLADAITPNATGGQDAAGGHVESLTEAAMGITNALVMIAHSIQSLSEAVRDIADKT